MLLKTKQGHELSPRELYALLKLRAEVFVVEQHCHYNDLDGADLDSSTLHMWFEDQGQVVSMLRILSEIECMRIGRVLTAAPYRSNGVAAKLMGVALDRIDGVSVLSAQSHLKDWYGTFGYQVVGKEYLDAGIPHLPMRREG